ncbi:MAG: type VI secretion system baseplate subunit TssK [Enterobacter hormaechei]
MLPVYDHDDLALCFGKLMLMLRQGLSLVMEDHMPSSCRCKALSRS